jgi:hypothetical protein
MTDELTDPHPEPVVVAIYAHLGEAEVTRAHLAANGIEAFIIDEVEAGTIPVEGEGGVAVAVRAQDAELARQVIAPVESADEPAVD